MPAVLTLLRIKNLALVEELEWQMGPGFIAVTGETGAGKSIIIGALQLLLGERADKSLIRTGADLCTVEAVFSGNELQKLNPQLVEAGIEPCENELIIKRSLSSTRNQSTVHQWFAHHPVDPEKSRRRTRRSSRAARSPVVALAGEAVGLLDSFARAEERLDEYRNTLPAIADTARRTCRPQHRRNRTRTGTRSSASSDQRDQICESGRG